MHQRHLFALLVFLLVGVCSCEAPFSFPPQVGRDVVASIVPSRITGVAPLAVHFDATGSTSVLTAFPYRDILYKWDFGDTAAASQVWPYGAQSNTLSKNLDTGFVAAHVFEQPGDYTVKLTCFDGQSTFSTTVGIHVDDPATVYSGARTICVSSLAVPVPGMNGVPAGAQCFQLSSVEAAVAKLSGPNQRLLFCRGDSFTISTTLMLGNTPGLTIGAYGSAGAKPMLVFQNIANLYGFGPQAQDFRIMDLQFSTLQTGAFASRMVTTGQKHQLLLNLDAQGISCITEMGGTYNFVVNCTLTQAKGGSGNVAIWYRTSGIGGALLGNRIVDCTGIEHNIRTHGINRSVIAHNYLAIANSQKKLLTVRGIDNSREVPPVAGDFWTELVLVSDNQFGSSTEAGGPVQVAPQATSHNEPIRSIILEKNLFVESSLDIDMGDGLTIRNNLAIDAKATGHSWNWIWMVHQNLSGSPTLTNCHIVNNTLYTALSGGVSFVTTYPDQAPNPSGIRLANNLAYAPNAVKTGSSNGSQGTMLYSFGGIDVTSLSSTTDAQLKGTFPGWVATVPATVSDLTLLATSYGHNSVSTTPIPVLEDFLGTLRTGTLDMGAFNLDP